MRKVILILLAIVSISCKHESVKVKKETKELVAEKLTYEVINFILESTPKEEEDATSNYIAYEDPSFLENEKNTNDYMGISKMDTLFTKPDVKFIVEQNKTSMNFSLKQSLLKKRILIPNKVLAEFSKENNGVHNFWERFRKKYGNKGFNTISKPLFSLDKKTVIISTGFHCGGLCGGGSTIILRQINGKWTYITRLGDWAS